MEESLQLVDMSNVADKRRVMQYVQGLKGLYEVRIKQRKLVRSLSANKFYFAAVVTPFRDYLRSEWGDSFITTEDAHEVLKRHILGVRELVNETTGDVMELPHHTHTMDTATFAEYVDQACAFVSEFAGIVPIPKEMFLVEKARKAS